MKPWENYNEKNERMMFLFWIVVLGLFFGIVGYLFQWGTYFTDPNRVVRIKGTGRYFLMKGH